MNEWLQGAQVKEPGFYFKYTGDPFSDEIADKFHPVYVRLYGGNLCIMSWEINEFDWFFPIATPGSLPIEPCKHNWVPADNDGLQAEEMCTWCPAFRAKPVHKSAAEIILEREG